MVCFVWDACGCVCVCGGGAQSFKRCHHIWHQPQLLKYKVFLERGTDSGTCWTKYIQNSVLSRKQPKEHSVPYLFMAVQRGRDPDNTITRHPISSWSRNMSETQNKCLCFDDIYGLVWRYPYKIVAVPSCYKPYRRYRPVKSYITPHRWASWRWIVRVFATCMRTPLTTCVFQITTFSPQWFMWAEPNFSRMNWKWRDKRCLGQVSIAREPHGYRPMTTGSPDLGAIPRHLFRPVGLRSQPSWQHTHTHLHLPVHVHLPHSI